MHPISRLPALTLSRGSITCLQVLSGTLLMVLSAHLKIFLPFTPVPITLQTFAAMGLGAWLGSQKGALAVGLFIAGAALGLPFTAANTGNPLSLLGVTGGYIAGFVIEAYLVGLIVEKFSPLSLWRALIGFTLAAILQLSLGTLWLGFYVGFSSAWQMGFAPFVPGEILKAMLVALPLVSYRHWQRWRQSA
jgi:biotin transport system substrate-specific component